MSTATPEIYPSGHTLSLHDALPIFSGALERGALTGRADEPRQVPALAFGPADLDGLLRFKAVPFRNVRYGSRRPRRGAAREHGGWKDQTPEIGRAHV